MTLDDEGAEWLLREALENIREVNENYPALTGELQGLLLISAKAATKVYFRIGRETESPSVSELADRQGCPLCDSRELQAVLALQEGDNGE